ncbi:MAG: T9SS type A sorting domain-containing protein, partial [Chitinophagaceae bacterium]
YPNPFKEDITLKLSLEKPVDKLNVIVADISGRAVFTRELRNVTMGVSHIQLGMNGNRFPPGTYFIRIQTLPGGKFETIKVIKK